MSSTETFLLCLGVGSALIAFWVVLRFPDRGPGDMRRALVHILGALAVGWIAPYLFDTFISYGTTIVLVAVFTIVFPALLYAFLASAWFIRIAHAALTR